MRTIEEEAVPSIEEDSSKRDPLVDDARDSVEEPLVDGTASQEENGNTKRRPRSVVNVDFFIDAILLLIGFFPNNMGNGKKGKHYVKNLLFIFKKPSKTLKIRVICKDFCKRPPIYKEKTSCAFFAHELFSFITPCLEQLALYACIICTRTFFIIKRRCSFYFKQYLSVSFFHSLSLS